MHTVIHQETSDQPELPHEGRYLVANELGAVICTLHYVGYGNKQMAEARANFIAGCFNAHESMMRQELPAMAN